MSATPLSLELKLPPLALAALVALLMWVVSSVWPSYVALSSSFLLFAGAIALAGLGVAVAAIVSFRRERTTVDPRSPSAATSIVTGGIFRYTRNPMYLGFILVLMAWAMVLANALSALLLPAFVAYLSRFQVQPEERALLCKFGAQYGEYMARVRRWL